MEGEKERLHTAVRYLLGRNQPIPTLQIHDEFRQFNAIETAGFGFIEYLLDNPDSKIFFDKSYEAGMVVMENGTFLFAGINGPSDGFEEKGAYGIVWSMVELRDAWKFVVSPRTPIPSDPVNPTAEALQIKHEQYLKGIGEEYGEME